MTDQAPQRLDRDFYAERADAQEARRISEQNARVGYTPPDKVANPRRVSLDGADAPTVAPVQMPVRLPERLIEYTAQLVREALANTDPADGPEPVVRHVVDKLREVDVAQLKV